MTKKMLSVTLPVLLFAGCNTGVVHNGDDNDGELTPPVNIQVTEYKDAEAFEKIISELEARGIKGTILTNADFATENCERLRALYGKGFEIMVFARPEPVDGESITLSMLSYEEQEELIAGAKTAIENCLGTTIAGFRCTRFDQNEDTYEIVDSLGFEFNLGFVARTERCFPGHEDDTLPYPAPSHSFWAVPMHSVYLDDQWVAFCDNPFRDRVDADGWEALLKSELDNMRNQGRPLLVEVHPYYSGVDEGRLNAFVNFLDYGMEQNARFVTVAELVEWSDQGETGGADQEQNDSACQPCQED